MACAHNCPRMKFCKLYLCQSCLCSYPDIKLHAINLTSCGVKVSVTLLTVLFWLSVGFPNEYFGNMSWASSAPMFPALNSPLSLVAHSHSQAVFDLRLCRSLSLKPCHSISCTSQSDSSSQRGSDAHLWHRESHLLQCRMVFENLSSGPDSVINRWCCINHLISGSTSVLTSYYGHENWMWKCENTLKISQAPKGLDIYLKEIWQMG